MPFSSTTITLQGPFFGGRSFLDKYMRRKPQIHPIFSIRVKTFFSQRCPQSGSAQAQRTGSKRNNHLSLHIAMSSFPHLSLKFDSPQVHFLRAEKTFSYRNRRQRNKPTSAKPVSRALNDHFFREFFENVRDCSLLHGKLAHH